MAKIVDKIKDVAGSLDRCDTTDDRPGAHFSRWGAEKCERDNAKDPKKK